MPQDVAIRPGPVNFEPAPAFEPFRATFSVPEENRRKFWVRWPAELAACVELVARPSERFVLAEIVRLCDGEGKSWPSVTRLARSIPRSGAVPDGRGKLVGSNRPHYSVHTIRVALRRLRNMGLLVWDRVWSFGRFPPTPRQPKGQFTSRGGRVWRPNLDALGMFARAKRAGEAFASKVARGGHKLSEVLARTLAPPPPPIPKEPEQAPEQDDEPQSEEDRAKAIEALGIAMGVRKRPGDT